MTMYYVLNAAGEAEPVTTFREYARWFKANPDARVIGKTQVGEVEVSTVFFGVNPQGVWGLPLIFETMIFGGEWDEYQWRWSTRAQAVAAHDQIVAALRDGESPEAAVTS